MLDGSLLGYCCPAVEGREKFKCTTSFLHDLKVPWCSHLLAPFKPLCKRHPGESEIGLTLRREGLSRGGTREEGVGYLWFIFFSVIRSIK